MVKKMNFRKCENIYKSAPLHDIGKIRIPDAILNKPGKLTPEEFDIMKKHSVYGGAIIDELIESLPQASYLEAARDIALYHHERWDAGLSKWEVKLYLSLNKACFKDR